MYIIETAQKYYGHLQENTLLQCMEFFLENNEPVLMKAYSTARPFNRYQTLKKLWYELLPENHVCRSTLCVEMLEFILNMHHCHQARRKR